MDWGTRLFGRAEKEGGGEAYRFPPEGGNWGNWDDNDEVMREAGLTARGEEEEEKHLVLPSTLPHHSSLLGFCVFFAFCPFPILFLPPLLPSSSSRVGEEMEQ
jgi:hypothetical protein